MANCCPVVTFIVLEMWSLLSGKLPFLFSAMYFSPLWLNLQFFYLPLVFCCRMIMWVVDLLVVLRRVCTTLIWGFRSLFTFGKFSSVSSLKVGLPHSSFTLLSVLDTCWTFLSCSVFLFPFVFLTLYFCTVWIFIMSQCYQDENAREKGNRFKKVQVKEGPHWKVRILRMQGDDGCRVQYSVACMCLHLLSKYYDYDEVGGW